MRRLRLALLALFVATPLFAAEPIEVEGVKLGTPKADVLKLAAAKAQGDKVTFAPSDAAQVDVEFDGKGKAKRIYAAYRKGMMPLKEFTQRYGEPVKRAKGDSIKYVYTVEGAGVLTLEKEKGYPGYYVEVVPK